MPSKRATRLRLAVGAAAMVTALLTGCMTGQGSASLAAKAPAASRTLLFYDGFDGAAGSAVDASKWSNVVSDDGDGNDELEYNTPGTANAALDGHGDLLITARKATEAHTCWYGTCKYTSARLSTAGKYSPKYGLVEAKMKLPAGNGLWTAFWMLGADVDTNPWPGAGEIDVLEHSGGPAADVQGFIHGPGYARGGVAVANYSLPSGQTVSNGFHIYAVDWSPDRVQFLVDGHAYETFTPDSVTGTWVFNKPFSILLDLAVPGSADVLSDDAQTFPASLAVDYVAVYSEAH